MRITPKLSSTPSARLFAVVVVISSLIFDQSPLLLIPSLFVLVVPFEKMFPRHDQPLRREYLGLDIAYALGQPALTTAALVAGMIVAILSFAWLPGLAFRPLVVAVPPTTRSFCQRGTCCLARGTCRRIDGHGYTGLPKTFPTR